MKKQIFILGAMLTATFALSSCNEKESLNPSEPEVCEGVPFEVSTVLTKTTNDGLSTNWAAEDAINLFHAVAGSTTYVSDGEFTVDKALTGKFSGTLASDLKEGTNYDWYANYPYYQYQKTPAGVSYSTGGYITVGGTSQTQEGNDSKAHLAGTACPLYGVVKNVSYDAQPSLTMNHLASVVAVKVTNTLEDALTVSSVSFSSTEDIVGTYYIDYSGDAPAYVKSGDNYVSKTAALSVTGGAAIAKNGSATFYIAIKPHTAASGSTLTLSVNGIEKTLTLDKDVTFTAGKIKTLNYSYDYVPAAGEVTIVKKISEISGTTTNGTVVSSMTMDDVITLSASSDGNTGKVYSNGADWRFYQNGSGKLTISAKEGYELKSATITFTNDKSGTFIYSDNVIESAKSVSLSGNSAVFSVGCLSSNTKNNGVIKISEISVTYVKSE